MNQWLGDDGSGSWWLFPFLHGTPSPGKKIGNWLKDLVLGSSCVKYKDRQIQLLPAVYSGASSRVGVCNTLAVQVPTACAVWVTGHDLKGISADFEYFKANVVYLTPGSTVLTGWPTPTFGRPCLGQNPASLAVIVGLPDRRRPGEASADDRWPPAIRHPESSRVLAQRLALADDRGHQRQPLFVARAREGWAGKQRQPSHAGSLQRLLRRQERGPSCPQRTRQLVRWSRALHVASKTITQSCSLTSDSGP